MEGCTGNPYLGIKPVQTYLLWSLLTWICPYMVLEPYGILWNMGKCLYVLEIVLHSPLD